MSDMGAGGGRRHSTGGERRYPKVSPLTVARGCVCPRCGRGSLYSGFLTIVDECPECGLALARNDNGDGPAVFLIFILGFVVVPPIIWLSMNVEWPLWVHAILWSVVILGLTLGMLRPAKAYTIALQYKHHPEIFQA